MESNYSGLKPPYKRGAVLYKRSESLHQANREGEGFAFFLANISNMVVLLSVLLGVQAMGEAISSSGCNSCKGLEIPAQGRLVSGSERPCKSGLHLMATEMLGI